MPGVVTGPWPAGTGLPLDGCGFLRVDTDLRAVGRDDVFAAGDVVAFEPGPITRSGVYAVRAGPVLDGAREMAAQGVLPTMQPRNLRAGRAVREDGPAQEHPAYQLLFDPQTAGGLLAGVPAGEAEACVAALRQAGYSGAAKIGTVLAPGGNGGPVTLG